MSGSRNIFAKVGAAPELASKEQESESDNEEQEIESEKTGRVMNMKQEGPFLVPQMGWMKDNLNLDNLTSDFLESNVTGEVMNLDDFLKELQVNELTGGADLAPPAPPPQMSPGPLRLPHGHGAHQGASGGGQQTDDRFHNLIRPANIENLKEHLGPGPAVSRPSIMHHVGKPPDLNIKYPEHQALPPVSLPYRDAMQQSLHLLSPPLKDGHSHPMPGHHLSPGSQGPAPGPPGIPQASVRPLVRPAKHEPMDPDIKPHVQRRKRQLSECSNFSEDEDDEEGEEGGMGNFTSTVCVNFSEDDLRLATIPGQVKDFDPATRRFSEEELKPQPIIRKRKKQFVPDELKNNKYWAKRYKNNEAAKRSREARRLKENQIAMRARFLEEENNALKGEVDVLKKENSDLKQMMMALEEKFNKISNSC